MSEPQLSALQLDELSAYLRQILTDRPGLQVRRAEAIGAGWETDLYTLWIESGADQGARHEQLVLRLFHGSGAPQRADREFQLMRRLHRLGLPIPQVIHLAGSDSPLDSSFILMERIAGPTMRQQLAGASERQIQEALRRMAALLANIHRVAWQQALPEADPETPAAMLRQMQDMVERFRLDEFQPLLRWLEQRQHAVDSVHPALLHNDYHPDNLLVREGELVVIDWSFAGVGDFRLDLAWTVLLVGTMLGERYRQPTLRSYRQHRGTELDHFEYFEALKLGSRVLTLLTWLEQPVEIPIHRITPEAMRGDYKIHVLNPYRRLKQITGLELPTIERL